MGYSTPSILLFLRKCNLALQGTNVVQYFVLLAVRTKVIIYFFKGFQILELQNFAN